jgi:hypothetical protein
VVLYKGCILHGKLIYSRFTFIGPLGDAILAGGRMDLLIQPKNPVRPVPSVSYRETECYDGGPFLTYPLRKNKPWMIPNDELGETNFRTHDVLHPTPHEELEAFLQIWLYFGLIFEFYYFENEATEAPVDKKIQMVYHVFRSDDREFIISSDLGEVYPYLPKFY